MTVPVRYEVREAAARLTIDRPERRNALNHEVIQSLLEGLVRAAGDENVCCVVLTGEGDRAFCAGADLAGSSPVTGPGGGPVAAHLDRGRLGELLTGLMRHPQPVIARVGGVALAGGLGLMLACDLVVAAEHAEFGAPEVGVGLWPYMISAVLRRNVPRKVAMEMMLTARRYNAREAERWGMVNRVVPGPQLDPAVEELVGELASKSPLVLRLGKESFYRSQDLNLEDALAYLQGMLSVNAQSEDAAEGVRAFVEKRAPQWKGR